MITLEREDYLKTIYSLQEDESPVRTTAIARALNVEPASVTGVIKRLAELEYLHHEPYKGVTLTEAGRRVALKVIRRHRLIELYLIEALGYSWDEVHDEAERLEHAVSELFIERISAALGNPEIDPHGAPIPTAEGMVAARTERQLSSLTVGQQGIISQVNDQDPNLLRDLANIGVRPGVKVMVSEIIAIDGPIDIKIDGMTQTITLEAAQEVFVQITE